jgi:AraC-like DNA-binding protein
MAAENADPTPMRFSTDELPERERLARWREEFGRIVVKVDLEPLSPDRPFRVDAILQRLPGVGVAFCAGSAARLHRTRALAADGDDSLGLIVNMGTPAIASQRDTDMVLEEGDGVLVRTDEPGVLRGTRHLSLVFPRTALAQRLDDLDNSVMRRIPRNDGSLRLLLGYLRLVQADPGPNRLALQQVVTGHIHDVAALAIGANREAREQGKGAVGAARLAAAIGYIGKHFADPALTLASVAHHQQISPRYLQELLEQSGASFVARVNELRLKRAFALLGRFPDRPVSEIAAQVGFCNVSHFNRLFRLRFGDTPSSARRRA